MCCGVLLLLCVFAAGGFAAALAAAVAAAAAAAALTCWHCSKPHAAASEGSQLSPNAFEGDKQMPLSKLQRRPLKQSSEEVMHAPPTRTVEGYKQTPAAHREAANKIYINIKLI